MSASSSGSGGRGGGSGSLHCRSAAGEEAGDESPLVLNVPVLSMPKVRLTKLGDFGGATPAANAAASGPSGGGAMRGGGGGGGGSSSSSSSVTSGAGSGGLGSGGRGALFGGAASGLTGAIAAPVSTGSGSSAGLASPTIGGTALQRMQLRAVAAGGRGGGSAAADSPIVSPLATGGDAPGGSGRVGLLQSRAPFSPQPNPISASSAGSSAEPAASGAGRGGGVFSLGSFTTRVKASRDEFAKGKTAFGGSGSGGGGGSPAVTSMQPSPAALGGMGTPGSPLHSPHLSAGGIGAVVVNAGGPLPTAPLDASSLHPAAPPAAFLRAATTTPPPVMSPHSAAPFRNSPATPTPRPARGRLGWCKCSHPNLTAAARVNIKATRW